MRHSLTAGILAGIALTLAACGGTSKNVSIDPSDIFYTRDDRTGLCYAFVGSAPAMSVQTTGVAMTHVPCTEEVLAMIGGA